MFCVHQPLFFPPVFILNRFSKVATLVLIPETTFTKFSTISRVYLSSSTGMVMIPVPVNGSIDKQIQELFIVDFFKFMQKFKKTIQSLYGRCQGYLEIMPEFTKLIDYLLDTTTGNLSEVNTCTMKWAMNLLQLTAQVVSSEYLGMGSKYEKNNRLVEISTRIEDSIYLCGEVGYQDYMDKDLFLRKGISVQIHNYQMPVLFHRGTPIVDTNVSILSSLFLYGVEKTMAIISS